MACVLPTPFLVQQKNYIPLLQKTKPFPSEKSTCPTQHLRRKKNSRRTKYMPRNKNIPRKSYWTNKYEITFRNTQKLITPHEEIQNINKINQTVNQLTKDQ